MKCRQCGTEIAEKALICYKCGTATTEAKFQPVALRPRRSFVSFVILFLLVLLMLFGVYAGEMGTTDTTRMVGWATAVIAVLLLGVRLVMGRARVK